MKKERESDDERERVRERERERGKRQRQRQRQTDKQTNTFISVVHKTFIIFYELTKSAWHMCFCF